MKNLLEVTNSSIKQTQNIRGCVNGRRDNDVSMTTEVTIDKTTPTQRRSRVNPVGRMVTLVQQMARKTKEENRNEHRDWDKRTNLKLTGRTRREKK